MWIRQPDLTLLDGWIERALQLAEAGSRTQGKAFAARALGYDDEAAARSALEIAERLGDLDLRCTALSTLSGVALAQKDFGQACALMDQVMAHLPELNDPDASSVEMLVAFFVYLRAGDLTAAARASAIATETAAGLTPHHRLHAACWQILLPSATGRWDEVRTLVPAAERVVDANLAAATPCVMNASILLYCAAASAQAGDQDEAGRLESKAQGLGMEGGRWYQGWFEPPRIRLAMARNDLGALAEAMPAEFDWEWEPVSTFLDALAALGDRERIEAEVPNWLHPGTFAEPFALRALGIARGDRALLQQALERFEATDLAWHAEQTRRLL
jgi:MalT-like TPR region